MEIDHCSFPDHLLYDLEANTWITGDEREVTVGMTSLLSAIAGKFTSVRIRPAGTRVERGRSLGTLESLKFVGPIPSPLAGIISLANSDLVKRPKLMNDAPYGEGWIVRLTPLSFHEERGVLSRPSDAREDFKTKITEFHAGCCTAF